MKTLQTTVPTTSLFSADAATCGQMDDSLGSEHSLSLISPKPCAPDGTENFPDRMVKYPFPLREGLCCFFDVPRDLTEKEVNRITNYLLSLSKKTHED